MGLTIRYGLQTDLKRPQQRQMSDAG